MATKPTAGLEPRGLAPKHGLGRVTKGTVLCRNPRSSCRQAGPPAADVWSGEENLPISPYLTRRGSCLRQDDRGFGFPSEPRGLAPKHGPATHPLSCSGAVVIPDQRLGGTVLFCKRVGIST